MIQVGKFMLTLFSVFSIKFSELNFELKNYHNANAIPYRAGMLQNSVGIVFN